MTASAVETVIAGSGFALSLAGIALAPELFGFGAALLGLAATVRGATETKNHMQAELLEVGPSLSPRKRWEAKYRIEAYPFTTIVEERRFRVRGEFGDETITAEADTEDEAFVKWARFAGVPLWNEESFAQGKGAA